MFSRYGTNGSRMRTGLYFQLSCTGAAWANACLLYTSVTVAGVDFSNPLIAASGTFGFGREYNEFYPLSTLGGISSKGITLKERLGNPPPRIAEAPGCMLNAIGLQNPGVDYFIEHDLPWLKEQGTVVIANIAGNTPEEYCAMAEKLSDTNVDMLEMNISCPNVKEGGVQFGTSCIGVEPVSYTHLDVYKRQPMRYALKHRGIFFHLRMEEKF